MTTFTSTRTQTLPSQSQPRPASSRRKKDNARTEIWSSLLRQTRLAQARSRTQGLQHRDVIVLGGSPDDQRHFLTQYLARPPPPTPPSANAGRRDEARRKGEVRLSNRFAYGYGHVTLFSPPPQGAVGGSLLGREAEEVAKLECHCFAGRAEGGLEETLRRLLVPRKAGIGGEQDGGGVEDTMANGDGDQGVEKERRPSVVLLMSWHRPWEFLSTLRTWLALLARALLPQGQLKDESPLEVLKEYTVDLTVVLQHVEAQEELERENYKDDTFDYISQCLRTCLLPMNAGLVYTPSAPPPTQPGSSLNDVQKVLYSSLDLDIAALQPRTGTRPGSSSGTHQKSKDELQPRHNVVDRMAIVVPSGWDSVGKIRLLSETFSPETVMEGWLADLERASALFRPAPAAVEIPAASTEEPDTTSNGEVLQATGGSMEMYSSQPSPTLSSQLDDDDVPLSPSKMPKSAISTYEHAIQDPNAHKAPRSPQLEVTSKLEQEFLAEMRAQLQQLEAQDAERQRQEGGNSSGHSTAGSLRNHQQDSFTTTSTGALSDLGDVSFNVGGVNFSAEAAIERLKHPARPGGGVNSPTMSTPRTGTPKQGRREAKEDTHTPSMTAGKDLQTDKLEEYFASLMRKGAGGSASSTPSKAPPS